MVFAIEPEERLPTPSAEEVRAQLADWKQRITGLFADIRRWAPPDLVTDSSESVEMLEPLMERYGMAAERMPVLAIRHMVEQDAPFAVRHPLLLAPYLMRFPLAGAKRLIAHARVGLER